MTDIPEKYITITLGFLVVFIGGMIVYNYITKISTPLQPKTCSDYENWAVQLIPAKCLKYFREGEK